MYNILKRMLLWRGVFIPIQFGQITKDGIEPPICALLFWCSQRCCTCKLTKTFLLYWILIVYKDISWRYFREGLPAIIWQFNKRKRFAMFFLSKRLSAIYLICHCLLTLLFIRWFGIGQHQEGERNEIEQFKTFVNSDSVWVISVLYLLFEPTYFI